MKMGASGSRIPKLNFQIQLRKIRKPHYGKIYIVGQGTAAVAGQALSQYLSEETEIS